MSTGLQAIKQSQIDMWDCKEKREEMKKLICKFPLSEVEFATFIEIGKGTQLNPFLREIWVVKYDEKSPASIFIGRDGYRKAAQRDPEYDYHQVDAVYSNDKFSVSEGLPKHEYNLKDRGDLIGAYCVAKRHKSSRPIYVFAELREYTTNKSLWNSQSGKPATMIKKVAESQCLRACFQDLLGGTYAEEEMEREHTVTIDAETGRKLSKSEILGKKLKEARGTVIDSTPIEKKEEQEETGEIANPEQMKELHALLAVKGFSNGRLQKAMQYYHIETLGQLTSSQADHFIGMLMKEEDK